MKRTFILMGLAFLISTSPAYAQQGGEFQIKNDEVEATGSATDGTCEPATFPLQIDILLGPGTKVETVQGDQKTVGKFDPETGSIKTSGGPEKYVLEPDGKKGLTGFNTYDGCRWRIDFELNRPALAFAEAEAPAEPAASPTVVQEAPAAPVGADAQQEEGGGFPLRVLVPVATAITVVVLYFSVRGGRTKKGSEFAVRCQNCNHIAPWTNFSYDSKGELSCPNCGKPTDPYYYELALDAMTDEEVIELIAKDLGDALGTGKSRAQLLQEEQDEFRRRLGRQWQEHWQRHMADVAPTEDILEEIDEYRGRI